MNKDFWLMFLIAKFASKTKELTTLGLLCTTYHECTSNDYQCKSWEHHTSQQMHRSLWELYNKVFIHRRRNRGAVGPGPPNISILINIHTCSADRHNRSVYYVCPPPQWNCFLYACAYTILHRVETSYCYIWYTNFAHYCFWVSINSMLSEHIE